MGGQLWKFSPGNCFNLHKQSLDFEVALWSQMWHLGRDAGGMASSYSRWRLRTIDCNVVLTTNLKLRFDVEV